MSQAIAEILRQRVAGLSIVGKSAGLVRAITRSVNGKNKTFPVACTVQDPLTCSESTVVDLIPDSRYESIVYFEDLGSSVVPHPAERLMGTKYRVRLRLVGWMDTSKIGDKCTTGAQFIREIQEAVTVLKPYNLDPFKGLVHKVVSVQPQSPSIFGKYTYDEANRQYLNWPYDYFAIDIETTYILPPGCEEPIVPSDQSCFVTGGPIIGGPAQSNCKLVRACGTPEDGDVPIWDDESGTYIPGPQSAGGGIQSIVAGDNIQVDDTDPLNPIVSASTGGAPLWGAIGGTLSDQTDLQDALDLKTNTADLGTAAFTDSTNYATAAQGALAATAVQPGDLGTAATKDTSVGGNLGADAGKLLEFNTGGQIQGSSTNESLAAVTGDTQNGTAVRGQAQGGTAVEALSNTGHGAIINSGTGIGAEISNNSLTQPPLHVRNVNAADSAPLAHYEAQDGLGMQVLNNGALDWTSANGPSDTRDNLGLGTAALADTGDFDASGAANTAEQNAKDYTDAQITAGNFATGGGTATGTNTGDQTIILTGDVTGSGTGSFAATIANDAVTNAKMANMTQATLKGRADGSGTGDPQDLGKNAVKTILDLVGTNTGDQTLSGVLSLGNSTGANNIGITAGQLVAYMATAGGGGVTVQGPASTASTFAQTLGANSGEILTSGTPAGTFPTLNQSTTGSAATLTTGRTFQTDLASTSAVSFNGSANNTHGVTGTLPVTNGGTGRATGTTAYGLIAAGTTATGAQQTLPAGATTDILVGGGASALPVWTTATGSGAPVRATSPSLTTPNIGTPSAGTLTNCTGLPTAGLTQSSADTGDLLRWNGSAWAPTDIGKRISIPAYSSGNQANSSNTVMANATGSEITLPSAGYYDITYSVIYDAALTSTGAHFSANFSGTGVIAGISTYTTAAADGMNSTISANDGGLAVLSSRVATNNNVIVMIKLLVSVAGTIQLSWKSEISGSAITITNIPLGEAVKLAN